VSCNDASGARSANATAALTRCSVCFLSCGSAPPLGASGGLHFQKSLPGVNVSAFGFAADDPDDDDPAFFPASFNPSLAPRLPPPIDPAAPTPDETDADADPPLSRTRPIARTAAIAASALSAVPIGVAARSNKSTTAALRAAAASPGPIARVGTTSRGRSNHRYSSFAQSSNHGRRRRRRAVPRRSPRSDIPTMTQCSRSQSSRRHRRSDDDGRRRRQRRDSGRHSFLLLSRRCVWIKRAKRDGGTFSGFGTICTYVRASPARQVVAIQPPVAHGPRYLDLLSYHLP
jgi:hypothetical protein